MKTRSFGKFIAVTAMLLFSVSTMAAPIKVACIGDSITAGVGAKDRKAQAYPAQLQALLGAGYEVKNCGTSGIQMQNYLAAKGLKWGDQITAFQPDIVTIKLGPTTPRDARLMSRRTRPSLMMRFEQHRSG
jgi:lysophospholipase L1-like esterase